MNLNLYDIFSKLIPGGLILGCFHYCSLFTDIKPKSDLVIGILIFVIGFFIDAISSILERKVIFKTFGINPSINLLNGNNFGRTKLYRLNELNEYFLNSNNQDIINNFSNKEYLFGVIYSKVTKKESKRTTDFLALYSFSRNILVTIIIIFLMVTFFLGKLFLTLILFFLILLSWYRCKQVNYYFVKEVIQSFIEEVLPISPPIGGSANPQ